MMDDTRVCSGDAAGLSRAGQLEIGTLGKLIYCLKEIRCCLEAETLERIEQHMAEIFPDLVCPLAEQH